MSFTLDDSRVGGRGNAKFISYGLSWRVGGDGFSAAVSVAVIMPDSRPRRFPRSDRSKRKHSEIMRTGSVQACFPDIRTTGSHPKDNQKKGKHILVHSDSVGEGNCLLDQISCVLRPRNYRTFERMRSANNTVCE